MKKSKPTYFIKNIHHIFFDLDHTLWDFDRNAESCLTQIYELNELKSRGVASSGAFIQTFATHNRALWKQLEAKEITHDFLRDERFKIVLDALGIRANTELSNKLNDDFLDSLTEQTHLISGTLEVLEYLAPNYELHILSNGFDDIQRKKMRLSGIEPYFKHLVTFDTARARKPDRQIFDAAMSLANTTPDNSLMIGDTLDADIKGALNVGMRAVWFEPSPVEPPPSSVLHISDLRQLLTLL